MFQMLLQGVRDNFPTAEEQKEKIGKRIEDAVIKSLEFSYKSKPKTIKRFTPPKSTS